VKKRAAYLEKASLRTFILKYTFYVLFLMTIQCLQVLVIFIGSFKKDYYEYDKEDGLKWMRYLYLISD
jgi:hypothetical protein